VPVAAYEETTRGYVRPVTPRDAAGWEGDPLAMPATTADRSTPFEAPFGRSPGRRCRTGSTNLRPMSTRGQFRLARFAASAILLAVTSASAGLADEGMWTFDHFPSKTVAQRYGFAPSQAWLDHVRASSLRIAGGCSASFVSSQGLVMTNHHCVVECVGQLSTPKQDYVQSGFMAKALADEKPCPAFELDQLTHISDVTSVVKAATAGKSGDAANTALHAAEAKLQQSCGSNSSVRCDVVSLYHGGIYDLYRYKRYDDVRLVFAPEYAVAQFGGDPDNFNFPRYDYDIGLLRAYENGKPAASPDHLRWSKNGSKAGDLVFVSGNPGGTRRELTVAQLAYIRDHQFPQEMPVLGEFRGLLGEFAKRGPEQARESHEDLFFIENDFKAEQGRQRALLDPRFYATKVAEERRLRTAVASRAEIATIQQLRAKLAPRFGVADGFFFQFGLLGDAFTLVRAAAERAKPNAQRLPEFTDQALVEVQQELFAPVTVYKDLQELNLGFGFSLARRELGADDPLVRKILGTESPEQLAQRLIAGTHLDDPAVRKQLYEGGQAAIAASTDPMIQFAAALDPDFRAIRKDYEARVDAPTRAAAERIAKARFAVLGTSVDPDATFTARLSYGTVKGFEDAQGRFVQPYTTIGGLFDRATSAPPYALPQSWLDAKPSLNLVTPMNLVSTNDIIGGNSGSPLIDRNGEVVGLIFDGNIFSLGGDFGYDGTTNRAVSVDSRALLEGLRKVYHLDRIVSEIQPAL
jgi:hypothetical protein